MITLDTRRAVQAEFPARAERASAVRRLVAARLAQWRLEELTEVAVLATNELFANAVEYGSHGPGATVTVTVRCGERELRVEVSDSSSARPALRAASDVEESGRGLAIVDTVASAWGTEQPEPGGRGKKVWFTLPIREEW